MRERMKKKKNMIIGGLLAVVFLMTVGYAAFASSLNITGTANTSSWIIKITNIREKTKTSGVTNRGTSYTDLTANFQAELTLPGDSITYEVTVENQGNIDASLSEVTKTFTNDRYIEVTYSGLVKGQMLYKQGSANSTATMDVTITFKDLDYEGTFTNVITSNIALSLVFVQEGNNVDTTTKYLVTYDSRGGTPVESRYVMWDENHLGVVTPKKLGESFSGWFARPLGGGTRALNVRQASDFMENQDDEGFILYAYWIPSQYTFIFDAQGSTSNVKDIKKSWNSTNVKPSTTPTKKGYTLDGWYSQPNGQGLKVTTTMLVSDIVQGIYGKYNDVADGANGDEVTLYANWIAKEYILTFNSNEGSEVADQIVTWVEPLTLPSPTKAGYTFNGWWTKAPSTNTGNPQGNQVENGSSLSESFSSDSNTRPLTLYAHWLEN